MNSGNWSNDIWGYYICFVQWLGRKSSAQCIYNWREKLKKKLFWCFLQFRIKYSLVQNTVFWQRFILCAPYFTAEDLSIQVESHYVYGCYVAPITLGALRYVPYQKSKIQGHTGHIVSKKGYPRPVFQDRVSGNTFNGCKALDSSPIFQTRKV